MASSPPKESAASSDVKSRLLAPIDPQYDTFKKDPIVRSDAARDHPISSSSLFSKLFLSWVSPIMTVGNDRQLELSDMWSLDKANQCKTCSDTLTDRWDGKVSIVRTLCSIYMLEYLALGILLLISYLCDFLGPIVLQKTVILVSQEELDWNEVSYWLAVLAVSRLLKATMNGQYNFQCQKIMLRVTSAMMGFVFQKSMRLNSKSRIEKNTGDIVNIYTTDVNNIINAAFALHSAWVLPLIIAAVLFKLYSVVGNATFVGVGIILLTLFLNKIVATYQRKYFRAIMKIKDERMKVVKEIFGSIQIVKLNAWEEKFKSKLSEVRSRELKVIYNFLMIGASNISLLWGAPVLVSTATFATYALWMEQTLTASTVFTAIALFRLLQGPLRILPQCITTLIQAVVSIKRLNEFSKLEESDPSNVQGPMDLSPKQRDEYTTNNVVIDIKNGSFTWDRSAESVVKVFENFNMTVHRGELVVVHGKVASGKSSLCSVILGEMEKLDGSVYVGGKVAYCSQQAWIQNLTIRDNILFGNVWDSKKYKRVIEACGLKKDLKLFASGDKTEIGEKGINLSGGQKARISLARACYSDADIFVFDSPLSAVDAIVQNEIFTKCILSLLRNKTVILVSHNPEIIASKYVDKSVELFNDGEFQTVVNESCIDHESPLVSPLACRLKESHVNVPKDSEEDSSNAMSPSAILLEGFTPLTNTDSSFIEEYRDNGASGMLIDEEKREKGRVSSKVFIKYMHALGGAWIIVFLIVVQFVWQGLQIGSDFWLSYWTNESQQEQQERLVSNMSIYTALALGSAAMVAIRAFTISISGIRGARKLFNDMTAALLRAPMSYFDANPIGRQLNRYSDDISNTDFRLPFAIGTMLANSFSLAASLLTAAVVMRYFGLVFVPILYVYYKVGEFYISSARELQRMSKTVKSPLLSHVSQSFDGVHIIRGFGPTQVVRFINKNQELIDENNGVQLVQIAAQGWFSIRVQIMGGVILIAIALGSVLIRNLVSPGVVGLIFNYGLMIDNGLRNFVQIWSWLERSLVAPERIQEYIDITPEAPAVIQSSEPAPEWPHSGKITFEGVSFNYKESGKLVLDGLDFEIQPREKVGIVGRTGAGKSSLTMALFRINEVAGGRIVVDGVDTKSLGLSTLRGRFSIITQAPVLFKGTIRSYLDPFNDYSDEELWSCLRKVEMHSNVSDMEGKLEGVMEENGENFSVGERQLLCMARALLSRSKVVVMDEATASIDHETDMALQAVIRTEFKDSTVLTIAHRLDTVLDSDRIMVLDAGKIVEFDTPQALIAKGEGHFFDLAKEGGYLDRLDLEK